MDRYIKQEYTLGLEKPAYELEQKIKEYFGSYRCLLQEEPAIQRPSRKNDRDDRAFIDFDRVIVTERPVTPQHNYERDVTTVSYNKNRETVNNNRGQRVTPSQNGYDRTVNDGLNSNRPQSNYERDYIRPSSQSIGSLVESSYDDRRPGVSTQSQNDQKNPYEQYETNNHQNNPRPNQEPIYFPNDNNRNVQQSFNHNTVTQKNRPNSQTTYYPQSNRDFSTVSTTRQTTQSSSRNSEQPQNSLTPSQNGPGKLSQAQPNRPISSSQFQQSIQTSVAPVYRTTTKPTPSYYEYSRLI